MAEGLQRSANGLAGHLFEFYPPIVDSGFVGGANSYSTLFEDLPYALNGLVPLAAASEDARLTSLCDDFVTRVLSTQGSDGWLGNDDWKDVAGQEGSSVKVGLASSSIWARIPALQALTQYSEWRVKDTQGSGRQLACRAFLAVETFCHALLRRLNEGRAVFLVWSSARWPDLILTLTWLLEHPTGPGGHCEELPSGAAERLRALAWLARIQGFDWEGWFDPATFPGDALERANFSLYSHGVNNAVAVKWGAAWRAFEGAAAEEAAEKRRNEMKESLKRDAAAVAASASGVHRHSLLAWERLQASHGLPSGAFGADEHLAGQGPERGTELCVVVESMRSLSESIAGLVEQQDFTNAGRLIDDLERLAFNALPAALSDDQWAHQYLTQTNALFAGLERPIQQDDHLGEGRRSSSEDREPWMSKLFGNTGIDATSYGLAPNFPCCTVNFLQGWPKLLSLGTWLLFERPGKSSSLTTLMSVAFVPSRLELPDGGGLVQLQTGYPILSPEAPLNYMFQGLQHQINFLVRIPSWADLKSSEVVLDQGRPLRLGALGAGQEDAGISFVQSEDSPPAFLRFAVTAKENQIQLTFRCRPQIWHLSPYGGGLRWGPLTFALPLEHIVSAVPVDPEEIQARKLFGEVASKLHEDELVAKDPQAWRRALLVPSDLNLEEIVLEVRAPPPHVDLAEYFFSTENQECPLEIMVASVQWKQATLEQTRGHDPTVTSWEPWLSLTALNQSIASPTDVGRSMAEGRLPADAVVSPIALRPFGCTKLRVAQLPFVLF